MTKEQVSPLLAAKRRNAASVFKSENLLREARRQRNLPEENVPTVCFFDPGGDMVRTLRNAGTARRASGWACYHTDMYETEHAGLSIGVVGCAVGASFAVLVAEQGTSPFKSAT
jgi:hypothetical protein